MTGEYKNMRQQRMAERKKFVQRGYKISTAKKPWEQYPQFGKIGSAIVSVIKAMTLLD